MLISLQHGYAFFCTPKNASNSIEDMLKPHAEIHLLGSPQVRHTNVRDYGNHIQPYLQTVAPDTAVERVALIRDPAAWLHSWYRFRARSALRDSKSPNSTAHLSYGEFIEAYLSDSPPPFAQVGTQLDFLLDENGSLGVDRLFAYENIDDVAEYFSDKVGQKLSMRAINVSPTKVYKSNFLEKLGALGRRLRGRGANTKKVAAGGTRPNGRTELQKEQCDRLDARLAEEAKMHAAALRGPLLKTEWDGRHSGAS